jgi:HK97 family phage prohead protease
MQTRRAPMPVSASSWDEESRTFEAVASTGAEVQRRDKSGLYFERLDLSSVDLDSLIDVPVQLDHDRSVRSTVGRVIAASMEAEGLVVRIQLSSAADNAPVRERVADGTYRSVSIGYRAPRFTEHREGEKRVRTAKQLSIREISIVSDPADDGAKIRSQIMENDEIDTIETMPEDQADQIRSLAELAGLTRGWAEDRIDEGVSLEDARTAAREAMQTRSRNTPRIRVVASNDDPAAVMTRRADALHARVNGTAPTDFAREFMGETLRDHARACLEAAGVTTRGMSADEVFTRALGLSDFPNLLQGVGSRTLMSAYQQASSPLKRLARQSTIADFRPKQMLRVSGIGELPALSEHGEITHTARGEVVESYKLGTRASIFALSRAAMINDDLNAFGDWGAVAGRAAATTEASLIWKALTANNGRGAKLSDGKPIFHADHKNLKAETGHSFGDTGEDALTDAKLMIARQTDLDGKTPIYANGKFMLVSPENEQAANKLIANIYPATVADVNVNTSKFEVLTEPRIANNDFWLFCDPASLPVLEYSYLTGAAGPQLASRAGWETLGMEFRVVLDFGVGAIDFRGAAFIADVA